MNTQMKKILPLVVILLVIAVVLFSVKDTSFFKQISSSVNNSTDTATQKVRTGAFGELIGATAKGVEEDIPEYIRRPKSLEDGFSGYKYPDKNKELIYINRKFNFKIITTIIFQYIRNCFMQLFFVFKIFWF
jgi:hypothetical protein